MGFRWYICHYPARPEHYFNWNATQDGDDLVGSYSSFILANSEKHARALAKQRNIGEHVDGVLGARKSRPYPLASELLAKRRLTPSGKIDVLHATTFLSYLLMQSHSAPPCDILGDEGLLHQVIHTIAFGSPKRTDMVAVLRYFEKMVPGYWPKVT